MASAANFPILSSQALSELPTADLKLAYLEKQLSIETKVKEGAEKILPIYTSGSSKDKKLAAEAQGMLNDAKEKIDYIKMMINRLSKQKDSAEKVKVENGSSTNDHSGSGDRNSTGGTESGATNTSTGGDNNSKLPEVMSPLDIRIEELRHRLKVECAVVEGAKNVIKLYQNSKLTDRKALQEAQLNLSESSRKIDILRKALEVCRQALPVGSPKSSLLKADLDNSQSIAPTIYSPTIIFKKYDLASSSPITISKPAAVTGKLEVRLIGCQDLLDDIPGRSRSNTSTSDLKGLVGSKRKGLSLSSSRSYSVKDETSNEIMAVLKLDNVTVGQTPWKVCSQMAWDSRFTLNLERSRELEIQIYWHDWRSLCALKFLRLEEFVEEVRHGMALHLEPQGILFAEIKFIDPMVYRASKLQRQKLFRHKGKNILRPSQLNINVATWGRLIKRAVPQGASSESFSSSSNIALNKTPDKSDSRVSTMSSETESSGKSIKSSSSSASSDHTAKAVSSSSISSSLTITPTSTHPNTNKIKVISATPTAAPKQASSSSAESKQGQSYVKSTPSNASTLKVFDFLDEEYGNLTDSNVALVSTPGSKENTPPFADHDPDTHRTSIHSIDENELARLKIRYSPGPDPIVDVPDEEKTPDKIPTSRMTLDHFEFISVLGRGHFGKVSPPWLVLNCSNVALHSCNREHYNCSCLGL